MKKKLYRIGNSKEPTPQQMMRMAENLKAAYNGTAVSIRSLANNYENSYFQYGIYVSDYGNHHDFKTWPEAVECYRKLMKDAPDGS